MRTTKIACIDLDSVVTDSTARFATAEEAKQNYLSKQQLTLSVLNETAQHAARKEADDIYWKTAFTPELLALDTMIGNVDEYIHQLEMLGYDLVYLTSRPDTLMLATHEWLYEHHMSGPRVLHKPGAFQYVKTDAWKAYSVAVIAALPSVLEIVFIDDEQRNHIAVHNEVGKDQGFTALRLRSFYSLKEAVDTLK